jgi:ubiquinone/menaquinone biosynthesis C-methylase UbiE
MNNLHTNEIFNRAYGERTWEFYRPIIAEAVKYGLPGEWLDLGAGVGLLSECANRFGIKCIALEGSQDGIQAAQARSPALDIRRHLLEETLPFENESIATIICNQTIEHLSPVSAKKMLKECYRVLKSKGTILIYSPCKYVKKQYLECTHINLYTPGLIRKEIESAGFKVLRINNHPRMLLGSLAIARYCMQAIFKLFPMDILSATANCIAGKP